MKINSLALIALITLSLSACMSGSDSDSSSRASNNSGTNNNSNSGTRATPPSRVTPPRTSAPPPVVTSRRWLRLPMHYRLLLGQPHLWNEVGGTQRLNLRSYASAGSKSMSLNSTAGLVQGQLITYRGRNGQYYTAQIQSISNNNLRLTTNIQNDVFAGANAWNFYRDGSHPNWAGASAIADFAIRRLGRGRLNQGKHVLFGDSWFSQNTVFQRLKQQLPAASFSNKGRGGDTAGGLLSRFDRDVAWQNPKYVWVLTGTNDYWRNVSAVTYKNNMRKLINRIRGIGATPIVFDSSVGPLNSGSQWKTRLSRAYVTSVDQLANEN